MKLHDQWKKKLTRDWSSWAIYVALLLSGVEQIMREFGQSFLSSDVYGKVMTVIMVVTLFVKVLSQSPKTDNTEGNHDQSSDER